MCDAINLSHYVVRCLAFPPDANSLRCCGFIQCNSLFSYPKKIPPPTAVLDEDLKELAASLNKHTIPEKSSQYNVSDTLACHVWFNAVQVWEVKAASLSKSSTHKGAVDKTGEVGRGIGLRFPRFERVGADKKPEAATMSNQILEMYYAQDSIVGGGNGGDDLDGI